MTYIEKLNKLVVKITSKGIQGSGILFLPNSKSEMVYAITAKHCIYGDKFDNNATNADVKIEYLPKGNGNYGMYQLQDTDTIMAKGYDIAVLRIPKEHIEIIIGEIPCLKLANLSTNEQKCSFKGYPKAKGHTQARTIKDLTIIHEDSTSAIFHIRTHDTLSNEYEGAKELAKGYSGSAVFVGLENDIYLLGVVSEIEDWNNRFPCVKINHIAELIDIKLDFQTIPRIENTFSIEKEKNTGSTINIPHAINDIKEVLPDIWYNKILEKVEKDLKNYNPQRALEYIEDIINSIEKNGNYDFKLMARLKYLRGYCKSEKGGQEGWIDDFLYAYAYEPKNIRYQEQALVARMWKKEYTKAEKLINEISKKDPYNITAWAAKYVIQDAVEIPDLILEGGYELQFKGIAGNFLLKNQDYSKLESLFNDEISRWENPNVTFENKNYWLLLINIQLGKIIHQQSFFIFAYIRSEIQNHPKLSQTIQLLSKILEYFDKTEKRKSLMVYYYILAYGKFLLEPTIQNVTTLVAQFEQLDKKNKKDYLHLTVAAFIQTSQFKEAIAFINQQKEVHHRFYYMQAYAYSQLNRFEEAEKAGKVYFDNLEVFSIRETLQHFIAFLGDIVRNSSKKISYYDEYFKQGKFQGDFSLKIAAFAAFFEIYTTDQVVNLAKELSTREELKSYPEFCFLICAVLRQREQFLLSNTILKYKVNFNIYNQEYDLYIFNLYNARTDACHLLELLENRRKKGVKPYDRDFIGMELSLLKVIPDYAQILEIMEIGLAQTENDTNFILNKIRALYELNKIKELQSFIQTKRAIFKSFSLEDIQDVIPFVLTAGDYSLIGEVLHPFALDKENIEARNLYYKHFLLTAKDSKSLESLTNTTMNCFIEIENNKTTKFYRVNQNTAKKDKFIKYLLDNKFKVGELFEYDKKFYPKSYKIINIYNESIGLAKEIHKSISDNEDPSMPFKSFKIPETDIVGSIDELIAEQLGTNDDLEKVDKRQQELDLIEKYKTGELSFSAMVKYCHHNPLQTYYELLSQHCLKILPLPVYKNAIVSDKTHFILDFTTIPLFFELSKRFNISFRKKFIISYFVVSRYKTILLNLEHSLANSDFYFMAPDNQNPAQYVKELLDWIEQNCEIHLVREKLNEIVKSVDKIRSNADIFDYLMDTYFLAIRENHVLISDDLAFAQVELHLLANRDLISSEKYLRHNFPDIYEPQILEHLLKFNYVGLTLSIPRVSEQLRKYLNGEDNYYEKCLPNLVATNSMKPEIAVESLSLVRIIYTYGASWELKKQETQRLFKVTLEGITDILPIEQIGLILVLIELQLILFSIEWIESVQEDFIIAFETLSPIQSVENS